MPFSSPASSSYSSSPMPWRRWNSNSRFPGQRLHLADRIRVVRGECRIDDTVASRSFLAQAR